MRLALRSLLSLLLLLALSAPALAEAPSMEAVAGFDGLFKVGAWVPVLVTLHNEGAEVEGELRYTAENSWGPNKQVGEYHLPVVLPAGATKEVSFLLPPTGSGTPEIQWVVAGEQQASVRPQLEASRDLLVGVLGVEPSDLPALSGMKIGDGVALRLVALTPERVPSEPLALESLDALLLDRFNWAELPRPEREAIQLWVEHGGRLLIAGGPEAGRLEGLFPWAPLEFKGAQTLTLEGIGPAPVAQADLKGSWTRLWEAGTVPLSAYVAKGGGRIHYLAFDPALEPFASWSGTGGVVADALPLPSILSPADPRMGGVSPDANLVGALSQYPLREIPASGRLLVWLGLYAFLIGPVHLLALRAFRRLGWALLTLPLLAAAGTGGAWLYLRQSNPGDVTANLLTVLEGQPGSQGLRVRSVAGLTMPPGSRHRVALGDGLLTQAPSVGGPFQDSSQTVKADLGDGRQAVLPPMENWIQRTLGARALISGAGVVDGTILIKNGQAGGKLTSHLSFPLRDAILVVNTSFQKLGDLEPGASAEVSFSLPSMMNSWMGKGGAAMSLAETVNRAYQFKGWGPEGPTPEQHQQMRRQQMTWGAIASLPWAQSSIRYPVVLVGWTDWQPLPVTVDGHEVEAQSLTMYVQPISYGFSDGDFIVPAGLLGYRVVESQSLQGGLGGNQLMPGWSIPKGGSMTLEFQVPPELNGRVQALEFRLQVLKNPVPKQFMQVEAFHWPSSAWRAVESNGDTAALAGPEWVSKGGAVRVRMAKLIDEPVPLGVPTLSLSGKGRGAR